MTDTRELFSKIAALRQRLEQAQGLVRDADNVAQALAGQGNDAARLRAKVEAGARHNEMLDAVLRPQNAAAGDGSAWPAQLTSRAARLLGRVRELLGQLRELAANDTFPQDNTDPVAQHYRETASMTDTVLRAVQAFPEAPSAQIRMCEGLEAIAHIVDARLRLVTTILEQRRRETARRNSLADLLRALGSGNSIASANLAAIAETVMEDARQNAALDFPDTSNADLPLHIAAHSLAVAQIIARLSRHDGEWRYRPLEPIMAALVHDVGMLKVPADVLVQKEPLRDEQRRLIEAHPIWGGDLAAQITPSASWLVEAAAHHHERIDGTGYPSGLRELQIKPLVRLLAICDAYTAMCEPRAYRPALGTRAALADTLMLADKGWLDANLAERLLDLSFYPIGTVVELSDGEIGVVVGTHQVSQDLNLPARPIVALWTDPEGRMLTSPRHIDLSAVAGRSILCGLTSAERRDRLGKSHPELAA